MAKIEELEVRKVMDEGCDLPDPVLYNYWQLAENRIIYIDFEIDESLLETQKTILAINIADRDIPVEERIPIKLLINSPGGLLTETFSLIDVCLMSKTPIYTVNMGMAYSAGALLLLAGHKRFSLPHGVVMLHTGSGGTVGTFEQTEEAQKNYKRVVDDMGEYILDRTTITKQLFKKNRTKDWYIHFDEQLKHGIVHEMLTDLDEIL